MVGCAVGWWVGRVFAACVEVCRVGGGSCGAAEQIIICVLSDLHSELRGGDRVVGSRQPGMLGFTF